MEALLDDRFSLRAPALDRRRLCVIVIRYTLQVKGTLACRVLAGVDVLSTVIMTLSEIQRLPPAEKEALFDVAQFTLVVVGCFEPTPFADLTNALLSMTRAHWSEAMLSVVGVVPCVGDLAKLGKDPRYLKSVERAIQLARSDRKFAVMLRPVLGRLNAGLKLLPMQRLPLPVQEALKRMQKAIADFLPGGSRAVSRLDQFTEDCGSLDHPREQAAHGGSAEREQPGDQAGRTSQRRRRSILPSGGVEVLGALTLGELAFRGFVCARERTHWEETKQPIQNQYQHE